MSKLTVTKLGAKLNVYFRDVVLSQQLLFAVKSFDHLPGECAHTIRA